jgi:aminoglycoside 3-N-acetyltransferase
LPENANLKMPGWMDCLLLVAERLARHAYWSFPRLRAYVRKRRERVRPAPQVADRQQLKEFLKGIGVTQGALVMAHTSVSGLRLTEEPGQQQTKSSPVLVAKQLVDDLLELVGDTGTLVMPTHARYQSEDEYGLHADPKLVTKYDPAKTPSAVGLANELFWRRAGVQRSLHPYNMLAACGPMAAELLRDNLNQFKPLPHGVHSGYYRFCQNGGLVVSIGVPLGRFMTLIHVAEEVRDQDWPIKDFFEEVRYIVRVDGHDDTYVVRQQRPEYGMFCLCMRKVVRDLLGEGILHESTVGSVRVDWADSREVFDYFMSRNEKSPYPYFWTRLVRKKP